LLSHRRFQAELNFQDSVLLAIWLESKTFFKSTDVVRLDKPRHSPAVKLPRTHYFWIQPPAGPEYRTYETAASAAVSVTAASGQRGSGRRRDGLRPPNTVVAALPVAASGVSLAKEPGEESARLAAGCLAPSKSREEEPEAGRAFALFKDSGLEASAAFCPDGKDQSRGREQIGSTATACSAETGSSGRRGAGDGDFEPLGLHCVVAASGKDQTGRAGGTSYLTKLRGKLEG